MRFCVIGYNREVFIWVKGRSGRRRVEVVEVGVGVID